MNRADSNLQVMQIVRALVDLGAVDALFSDRYLERAETLLAKVLSRPQYAALRQDHESVLLLTNNLRAATERQDWPRVRSLAAQASEARARVMTGEPLLNIGDAVYGPRPQQLTPTTLGLSGVLAGGEADLVRVRNTTLEQLRALARQDPDWRRFYDQRITHFERLQVFAEENPGATANRTELRAKILQAVEERDFAQVQKLVENMLSQSVTGSGRLRAPRPADDLIRQLGNAFPVSNQSVLQELGLKEERLPAISGLNEYLSCCCADRATLPESPLSECHRKPETCTCGHACPPEVGSSLRDNLDLLILHPFVTSGGTRYLPWFGAETLLVETFPESEPDARTALLEMLRLPKRCALTRLCIEDALHSHGARVCAELGLDGDRFVAVCIPYDAYLRLAPSYGWGRQERWTHFDGYQVTAGLRLHALVGGDVRYGGPEDLCGVARDYDADRITARFAIVRRQRFNVRSSPEEDTP